MRKGIRATVQMPLPASMTSTTPSPTATAITIRPPAIHPLLFLTLFLLDTGVLHPPAGSPPLFCRRVRDDRRGARLRGNPSKAEFRGELRGATSSSRASPKSDASAPPISVRVQVKPSGRCSVRPRLSFSARHGNTAFNGRDGPTLRDTSALPQAYGRRRTRGLWNAALTSKSPANLSGGRNRQLLANLDLVWIV